MSKNIPGNNKHLTLSDRSYIEVSICKGIKFVKIAKYLCKDPSTISKEVLKHRIKETSSYKSWQTNKCKNRFNCEKMNLCLKCSKARYQRDVKCHACDKCNRICKDFVLDYCNRTSKAPYVCNGCNKIRTCKFDHYYYKAITSQSEYRTSLIENRNGINIDENTLKIIDAKLSPLIRQGHSPYLALSENKDINLSVKTIYNYIDNNVLSVKNLDLPKKVKYKLRKPIHKISNNKTIYITKTYIDYLSYKLKHPSKETVEMDTVLGCEGSKKVLLTLLFKKSKFMLAFLLEKLHYKNVLDVFNYLEEKLGTKKLKSIMPIVLTDRGSEFSHPKEIEMGINNTQRTTLFFCNAMAPYQKGTLEKNHEYIRKILPKGSNFDNLTQEDINIMLSHINSVKRKSLNAKSPLEVFCKNKKNDSILKLLSIHQIPSDKIILTKKLFK